MREMYNAKHWYWAVAGNMGQVFSSARACMVPLTDSSYQAWLRTGCLPTRIASYVELYDVLLQQAPAVAHDAAPLFEEHGLLTPHQMLHHRMARGLRISCPAHPAIDGVYSIDHVSLMRLDALSECPGRIGIPDVDGKIHVGGDGDAQDILFATRYYVRELYRAEARALAGEPAMWPEGEVTVA